MFRTAAVIQNTVRTDARCGVGGREVGQVEECAGAGGLGEREEEKEARSRKTEDDGGRAAAPEG